MNRDELGKYDVTNPFMRRDDDKTKPPFTYSGKLKRGS